MKRLSDFSESEKERIAYIRQCTSTEASEAALYADVPFTPSARFDAAIADVINGIGVKKEKKTEKMQLFRGLAAAMAIIVVFSVILGTSQTVKASVFDFFTKLADKVVEFFMCSPSSEYDFGISDLPMGYTETSREKADASTTVTYEKGTDKIWLVYAGLDYIVVNFEEKECYLSQINGIPVYISEKGGLMTAYWSDKDVFFTLIAKNKTKDEIINMASSVKKKQ